ncbi:MAG: hypothetical protein ACTSXP_18690, partial [Promethearchaeota archaeon]
KSRRRNDMAFTVNFYVIDYFVIFILFLILMLVFAWRFIMRWDISSSIPEMNIVEEKSDDDLRQIGPMKHANVKNVKKILVITSKKLDPMNRCTWLVQGIAALGYRVFHKTKKQMEAITNLLVKTSPDAIILIMRPPEITASANFIRDLEKSNIKTCVIMICNIWKSKKDFIKDLYHKFLKKSNNINLINIMPRRNKTFIDDVVNFKRFHVIWCRYGFQNAELLILGKIYKWLVWKTT